MPDTPDSLLDQAVQAILSKAAHQQRVRAAEEQRDAAYAQLHGDLTYGQIEEALRARLAARGVTVGPEHGVTSHNVRRAIREVRSRA